jgi:hypothetical protein
MISFTSTPPNPAVFGGSYTPTATGGGSQNPVVFSIDPSAASVCSITGGMVSFTGVGTCVIDANQADDSTYSAAPQVQQSFTVTPAKLTVTADKQATQFGAADPALTATISGFVAGQTLATSGVTGSPSCTTTATTASPGGSYPHLWPLPSCRSPVARSATAPWRTGPAASVRS